MYIFVEDKLVRLVAAKKFDTLSGQSFDTLLDAKTDTIALPKLVGHVLVQNASLAFLRKLFTYFLDKREAKFESLTLVVADKKVARERIIANYRLIFAAGGVVFNDKQEILLMKRLGKWDLPKGKADAGETSKATAAREVEEECNVKVKVNQRLCTTWHTYWLRDKPVIKRTKWYEMVCLDDSQMKPQLEESIEELRWMNEQQRAEILDGAYSSIRFVLEQVVPQVSPAT